MQIASGRTREIGLPQSKFLIILLAAITAISGCQWDPPRDNPLDPGSYRFQPVGALELLVLDRATNTPIAGAEVRIKEISEFRHTDSLGAASFSAIPADTYWVAAERGGSFPYGIDSTRLIIASDVSSRDTLRLAALPTASGGLKITILTLNSQPIPGATVQVREPNGVVGRYAITNALGEAEFAILPAGSVWVTAFRENGGAAYGRDSIRVDIFTAQIADTSLSLNALPSFEKVVVNAIAYADNPQQAEPFYFVRLKAVVDDPDGSFHLRRVEARAIDFAHEDTIRTSLRYFPNDIPDSIYWGADIQSDQFYNSLIDNVVAIPFEFFAYDAAGGSAPPTSTILVRVLHGYPDAAQVQPEQYPQLRWIYTYIDDLQDTSLFNYLVRIYRTSFPSSLAYERLVAPNEGTQNLHVVDRLLPSGGIDYEYEVWVIDLYGNSSRSPRIPFRR